MICSHLPGPGLRRRLRNATAAAITASAIALGMGAVPAVAAPLSIQGSLITPIAADSPCSVEPKRAENNNAGAYDPSVLTFWPTGQNLAGLEDVKRTSVAGSFSDLCVGFRLDSDYTSRRVGNYAGPFVGAANPATSPVTGDDLKDVQLTLPAGYGARLAAGETCTDAEFSLAPSQYVTWTPGTRPGLRRTADDPQNGFDAQPLWDTAATCPDGSLVGEVAVRASDSFALLPQVLLGGGQYTGDQAGGPSEIGGAIWRLTPGPNELGRLGAQVQLPGVTSPLRFAISLRLATDGSGRVVSVVERAPRVVLIKNDNSLRYTYLESIALRLWGSAAEHPARTATDLDGNPVRFVQPAADFMEMPTRCDRAGTGTLIGTTYGGPNDATPTGTYAPVALSAPLSGTTFSGCEAVPFEPTVEVQAEARTPDTPTALSVSVRIDQRPVAGRLPSQLRDAAITLPRGLELGAQAGSGPGGLPFCAPSAFAAGDVTTSSACPAATQAADVTIESPLISRAFTGRAWLGQPGGGRLLPDLFLQASLAGSSGPAAPRIKLIGTVEASADGALTATFRDAPELRFSALSLRFPGGPNALFSTPRQCGVATGSAELTPWSGRAPTRVATSLTVDQGCGAAFAPTLSVEPLDPRAGRKAATRIVVTRPRGTAWLSRITARLPAGLLADLGAVTECAPSPAVVGDCPASSRIGTLRVLAGAGDSPLPIDGTMYLTAPAAGDVAGAVLVARAKVGDLDLGDVVVPGRIRLRPTDAGFDFQADVPTRVRGLALGLQRVEVMLDRENFALNPTACGPLSYAGEITGDGGETATPTGSVRYEGCAALPFRPSLQARLTGDNRPKGYPGMLVRLDSPAGDSAMRSASVTLPQGVAAALPNVQNPCRPEQFASVSCPATTRIGSAVATVSVTPDAVTGDVYLLKVPGQSLPGLGLSFRGRYSQRVTSTIEVGKNGRLITTFPQIPDLPLRSLTIQVDSGPKSPLRLAPGPCAVGSGWEGRFVAQGGQVATARTGLQCVASGRATLNDRRGFTVRLSDFGGRQLHAIKATLPKGWRFDPGAARSPSAFSVRIAGAPKPRVRITVRSMTAWSESKRATDARLRLTGRSVRPVTPAARRAKRVTILLRLGFTDGTVQTQELSVATR